MVDWVFRISYLSIPCLNFCFQEQCSPFLPEFAVSWCVHVSVQWEKALKFARAAEKIVSSLSQSQIASGSVSTICFQILSSFIHTHACMVCVPRYTRRHTCIGTQEECKKSGCWCWAVGGGGGGGYCDIWVVLWYCLQMLSHYFNGDFVAEIMWQQQYKNQAERDGGGS